MCDCQSAIGTTIAPGNNNGGTMTSCLSTSQITMALQLVGLDSLSKFGICYGYCIVSFLSALVLVLLLHQGIRIFSAPSIFHHTLNAAAIVFLFLLNNATSSSMMWADDGRFLALCSLMASLFVIVHWNYTTSSRAIAQASSSNSINHSNFQSALNGGLNRMDSLLHQLCAFRYLAVAIYCSFLLFEVDQQQ
jgi:Na+-transporting NADH:ubiquinone oxidoreductase subunit NqrB